MKTDRPWERPEDDFDDAMYTYLKASRAKDRLFALDLALRALAVLTEAVLGIRDDLAEGIEAQKRRRIA